MNAESRAESARPEAAPADSAGRAWNVQHLAACLLAAVTSVLLTFGALVTTYEAAMAVPDWPGTYGHNLLLFPFAEWLHGPWDLFLEHGHRLLGAVVGAITLLVAVLVWSRSGPPVVVSLAIAAVLLVVMQGALGGARVLLDDKTIAKVHACTGPLFFAVTVALAALTRGRPRRDSSTRESGREAGPAAVWTSVGLVAAVYMQLVAGAQLRHVDPSMPPDSFRGLVAIHISGAVVVLVLALVAVACSASKAWPGALLACACCQWLLGLGTWAVSWGLPTGFIPESWQPATPLHARVGWGAAVVTGHVLLGMLMLGLAVVCAIRAGALDRVAALGSRTPARDRRRFA